MNCIQRRPLTSAHAIICIITQQNLVQRNPLSPRLMRRRSLQPAAALAVSWCFHQFSGGSPSFGLVSATDSGSGETWVSEQWGTAASPRRSSSLATCWQMIQGRDPATSACFVTTAQFRRSREKDGGWRMEDGDTELTLKNSNIYIYVGKLSNIYSAATT